MAAADNPVNNTDPTGMSWCDLLPVGCGVLPGGDSGVVPNNQGFTQFSLGDYGHNQCTGFPCGYVWNPIVHYYYSLAPGQATSSQSVDHMLEMLDGLYSKSPNPTVAAYCQESAQSCLENVWIPGIASVDSSENTPTDLFQLSTDNSIVWWSMKVGPSTAGGFEVADDIDLFDNLVAPFLDLLDGYQTGCSSSGGGVWT
jgi:hypothetical protein